ncbi:MAG: 50S ribosomal protein L25, partial [Clostridia bacterium]|nr:50S ribosomal protein L25 [Clostridia bacterium]
ITHVDIQRVSLDEKIHASVPIKTVGKEKLDRTKSVIVHQLNEVTIECFPSDVPAFIEADISGMKIGNSLTASQLKLPQGAKLVTAPGDVVLSITTGRLDLKVSKADEPVVPQGEEGKLEAKRA